MKITVCQDCHHKIFSFFYTPKFCRNCRSQNLDSRFIFEWIILAVIVLIILRSLR